MLTTFILIQVGINLALVLGLVRLLKEREAALRQARQREDRLEALAAELCALGRDFAAQDKTAPESLCAPQEAAPVPRERQAAREKDEPATAARIPAAADRFQGAVSLLERGVPLEAVAVETALPDGEVQVLRNLARAPAAAGRGRRAQAVSKKETSGERRRRPVSGGCRSTVKPRAEA
jgi:hypothetical protein